MRRACRWCIPPTFERLQIKYMNPVVKRVARLMPGVAKIRHRGRKSGKTYETVVTRSARATCWPITLGHGKTDWVKNVLAADEADVLFGKRTFTSSTRGSCPQAATPTACRSWPVSRPGKSGSSSPIYALTHCRHGMASLADVLRCGDRDRRVTGSGRHPIDGDRA